MSGYRNRRTRRADASIRPTWSSARVLSMVMVVSAAILILLSGSALASAMDVVTWNQHHLNTYDLQHYGCAATATAMICNYYGSGKNLQQSIDLFIQNHILDPGGWMNKYTGLSEAVGGTAAYSYARKPGSAPEIRAELDAGHLLKAWDDSVPHHYVIVGYEGSSFIINDPSDGARKTNPYRIDGYHVFTGEHSTPVPNVGSAWKGEYFSNVNLSGTPRVRADQNLNFDWGNGSPGTGIAADNFSVRWTRTLSFEAGTYRFTTLTDDGVRLWVDGKKVIDKWVDMPATSINKDVPLTTGSHTIKMEYYERGGGAVARLSWAPVSAPTSAVVVTPIPSAPQVTVSAPTAKPKVVVTPTPPARRVTVSVPADPNLKKILRNTADGACYLITASGKRAWIPTGGDYTAMVNNGAKVVQTNWAAISRYPDAGYKAVVRRLDDPVISGPSKWIIRRSGTSAGWEKDYYLTQSAAGKSYVTNAATWTLSNGFGYVRVNAYIPTKEAVASVVYHIYDGSKRVASVSVNQKKEYGFIELGTWKFSSGKVVVKISDNEGAGPYGALMGLDCIEGIPVG